MELFSNIVPTITTFSIWDLKDKKIEKKYFFDLNLRLKVGYKHKIQLLYTCTYVQIKHKISHIKHK